MTLPSSGSISLNQVNVELGNSGTASINMGSAAVRGLFGVSSGAISMSNGYGKANEFAFTISSSVTNANLRTLAVNAGWNQTSYVKATINSGVYCYATSTSNYGLTVNGSWPNGVNLDNNGVIAGRGGAGGQGRGLFSFNGDAATGLGYEGTNGGAGGTALYVTTAVTIDNGGGAVRGGGGGGGGGRAQIYSFVTPNAIISGGGGGGGASNGTAGLGGNCNTNNAPNGGWNSGNGNPGSAGSLTGGGAGGTSVGQNNAYNPAPGGAGGGWGSAGTVGGGNSQGTSGGAAGAATNGNSNITWSSTGTRTGSLG